MQIYPIRLYFFVTFEKLITTSMKKIFLLSIALTFYVFVNAQVKGTVIDGESNTPFSGVTVLKKGTRTLTVTGANGGFSINATVGDTLLFSFIGYEDFVYAILNNRSDVQVTMRPSSSYLEEIVVVGYGVQRKSDVYYSRLLFA